ncbi:alpha/beta hydrolase [Pseudomonas citronellolis]|uniref:alpha/beta hydrolase n=1 Tax=Pseudomonas citronellolis TaxID=53408 RepID=UPI0023E3E44F|nr:alpha/beta hydrolase [Pseudomonas citronellolis]MDF3932684.1 alpha/beta hydrolase [Pseudomonas citronellolis]
MLHPEISAFLDMVDEGRLAGRPVLHDLTPAQARAEFEASSAALKNAAPTLPVRQLRLPTRQGELDARLYLPENAAPAAGWPVLLYLHGGGYTVGSLDSHDGVCRQLARDCACAVLAPAYRLAPETPFPGAVEDTRDSWNWLQGHAAAFALDPARVALAGDSAGATLASVLAAELAAEGAVQPRAQLLFYPAVDATRYSESMELFAEGYLLESASLDWFYAQYAPTPEHKADWRCSPLYAGERLRGSAPALLQIAEYDPLQDEGLAYAKALEEQGVDVSASLCRGLTHDFLRMGGLVPEVAERYRAAATFLASRW